METELDIFKDSKRTMLIVDDEEVNRLLLGNIFNNDYIILEAEDGEQAWDILQEKKDLISIVLLDLMMPVMSGDNIGDAHAPKPSDMSSPVTTRNGNSAGMTDAAHNRRASDALSRTRPALARSQIRSAIIRKRLDRRCAFIPHHPRTAYAAAREIMLRPAAS